MNCSKVMTQSPLRRAGARGDYYLPLALELALQSDYLEPAGNLFRRNQFSLTRTWAHSAHRFPGFWGMDIAFPERPGAALSGPNGIDRATSLPVIKYAISVNHFAETTPARRGSSVESRYLVEGFTAIFCDGCNFLFVNPNVARQSRAAITATRAAKTKAILVPRLGHGAMI